MITLLAIHSLIYVHVHVDNVILLLIYCNIYPMTDVMTPFLMAETINKENYLYYYIYKDSLYLIQIHRAATDIQS